MPWVAKLEEWRREEENSGRISQEQLNISNGLISETWDIRGRFVTEIFFWLLTSSEPHGACGHLFVYSVWEPGFSPSHIMTRAGQPLLNLHTEKKKRSAAEYGSVVLFYNSVCHKIESTFLCYFYINTSIMSIDEKGYILKEIIHEGKI